MMMIVVVVVESPNRRRQRHLHNYLAFKLCLWFDFEMVIWLEHAMAQLLPALQTRFNFASGRRVAY